MTQDVNTNGNKEVKILRKNGQRFDRYKNPLFRERKFGLEFIKATDDKSYCFGYSVLVNLDGKLLAGDFSTIHLYEEYKDPITQNTSVYVAKSIDARTSQECLAKLGKQMNSIVANAKTAYEEFKKANPDYKVIADKDARCEYLVSLNVGYTYQFEEKEGGSE